MKLESLLRRITELIDVSRGVMSSLSIVQSNPSYSTVDDKLFYEFRTASLSFLKSTFGEDHPYYKEFDGCVSRAMPHDTVRGIGILTAVKKEIDGGWLVTVRGLVSAEIFSDFLEMAGYLLSENYKDPAAVVIGSVLEEHLRQLANKSGIPTEITKDNKLIPKKAEMLNEELATKMVYNKLDQKSVTSWLDLRNKAAHGKYSEYTKKQVDIMYDAVTNFISRVSL